MAEFAREHGTAYGVVNHDRGNYTDSNITNDELVIADGPRLDFFKITAQSAASTASDIRGQLKTGESVERILQLVQQRSTVAMYQVNGGAADGVMSVAVYPVGAWTAASLQTAVRALGTVDSTDLDTSLVTSPGFELA